MLIRKKITALIFGLVSVIFLLPTMTLAQVDDFGSEALNGLVTATTRSLFEIVTGIVNTVLYFLGAIAILLFMYAGWLWFSSKGNREQIDKAKKIMVSATIGLAIIFSSYAIVNWLFKDAIQRAFYNIEGGSNDPRYGGGVGLGGGVIESHYPEPNATSVPRNTNIYITFKEPMRIDTIASATGCTVSGPQTTCNINTSNIHLHIFGAPTVNVTNMTVTYNTVNPTVFEFNPYGTESVIEPYLLGEQTRDIRYEMSLLNLRTADDRQAFNFGSYSWRFTVGTYSDTTPPRVVSVRPVDGSTSPRNAIVQINFSEAVNPTLASGEFDTNPPDFTNITLTYDAAANTARGRYVISNQYRTVEFIPSELCGTNSCGFDIFCLPGEKSYLATITTNIRDMVGNALAADYIWDFQTSNNVDTVPPIMVNMTPIGNSTALSQVVQMTFNKTLLSSSVNSNNVKLFRATNIPMNYWLRLSDASSLDNNVINIRHDRFDVSTSYLATSTSGIMDSNQNCWYPCRCEGGVGTCTCDTTGATCAADGSNCQTN